MSKELTREQEVVLAVKLSSPELASAPDWKAAELLNAADPLLPKVRQDVPTSRIRDVMLRRGVWARIVLTAEDALAPREVRELCVSVRDSLLTFSILETSDPDKHAAAREMLNGLVAAGVLTKAEADEIDALFWRAASWAEHYDIPVTPRTIGLVRGAR